jgi:hypothetical protein
MHALTEYNGLDRQTKRFPQCTSAMERTGWRKKVEDATKKDTRVWVIVKSYMYGVQV